MTVLSPSRQVLDPATEIKEREVEPTDLDLPGWYVEKYSEWGERLSVPEWVCDRYRAKHGWKVGNLHFKITSWSGVLQCRYSMPAKTLPQFRLGCSSFFTSP